MNYKKHIYYRIGILLLATQLFFCYNSVCQPIDDNTLEENFNAEQKKDSTEQIFYLKSNYFTLSNFLDTIPFGDTILTEEFPYFNPVDALKYPVADKGGIGSSVVPISGYLSKCGFNTGINGYDIYDKSKNDFKWHVNRTPFAQVFGSPSSIYSNFWVGTKFSRNFKDINLDIDYDRLNTTGKYANQLTKHTNLNFGLWKGGLNKRFNTYFNIIVNIHQEEENGGVQDPDFDPTLLKVTVPVNLEDAVSRIEKYELEFTEYFRIKDQYSILGFKPFMKAEIGYHTGFYKFYDNSVSTDSLYYGYLWSDPIGLRNYIDLNGFHASASLYGINTKKSHINAGLDYGKFNYTIEPNDKSTTNQIQLFANSKFNINPLLNFNIDGKLYFGNFSANYILNSSINFSGSVISAQLGAEIKNSSPSLMQQTLFLTSKEIYNNDFVNIATKGIFSGFKINKLGLSAKVNYDIIDHYIYFNKHKLPVQETGNISLLQLNVEENIRVWKFHFDNNIHLFNSSDQAIPVPQYVLRSKLYIDAFLFKKVMQMKTGFEFNYWDRYFNYAYNPAIGNYYVQNTVKLDNFMQLDYFVSAKISDFLIFIRINNILFPVLDKVNFKVVDYPHDDLFFRLGIKWTLLN